MCPNRDGSKGTGGCIYCNNSAFSPDYTLHRYSVASQIARGKEFFSRKYPQMKFLAYFQSYTSTNAPAETVLGMIREALRQPDIEGVVIGTRPDCIPQTLLDELREISRERFVMIEYGAESANDSTLRLINRCHTWHDTVDAVRRTTEAGIPVGLHFILGLPGEGERDMMHTVDEINLLPVSTLKFHQLQVVRGTTLADMIKHGTCSLAEMTPEEYIDLCCRILARLRDDIVVERFVSQAPEGLLISPRWGLKNYQFADLLRRRLNELGLKS